MDKMRELLTCPFCKAKPYHYPCEELQSLKDMPGKFDVICLTNDCALGGIGINLDKWNTRATHKEPEDSRERFERVMWNASIYTFEQTPDGYYANQYTQNAWHGWQAALSSRGASQAAPAQPSERSGEVTREGANEALQWAAFNDAKIAYREAFSAGRDSAVCLRKTIRKYLDSLGLDAQGKPYVATAPSRVQLGEDEAVEIMALSAAIETGEQVSTKTMRHAYRALLAATKGEK